MSLIKPNKNKERHNLIDGTKFEKVNFMINLVHFLKCMISLFSLKIDKPVAPFTNPCKKNKLKFNGSGIFLNGFLQSPFV